LRNPCQMGVSAIPMRKTGYLQA